MGGCELRRAVSDSQELRDASKYIQGIADIYSHLKATGNIGRRWQAFAVICSHLQAATYLKFMAGI